MSVAEPIVYLNGEYVPVSQATVPIDDRGFLLGDSCYEVTAVVDGQCVALHRHLARLQRGLDEVRIEFVASTLELVHAELICRNGMDAPGYGSVYVQVTRGVAPRSHGFPERSTPTVLVRANAVTPRDPAVGYRAITHPDIRWGRVDIKTTGLLPNVLAQQAAIDVGADDVILHRDGVVSEGAHTNVYGVIDGAVVTAVADHRILGGVTRSIVLELLAADDVSVIERDWTVDELFAADEVFMTSTVAGVRAIVEIDGRPVGAGRPGAIMARTSALFAQFVAAEAGR